VYVVENAARSTRVVNWHEGVETVGAGERKSTAVSAQHVEGRSAR
jgi:hypothetical protein